MTYLITGGAGFMGSHFVKHILNKYPDARVVNVDKLTYAGNLENLTEIANDDRYTFVQADIADEQAISQVFEDHPIDILVNYAAESHVDRSILGPRSFVETDVLGTLNLLEHAKERNIRKYIQISTDETYGEVMEGASHEESPFKPRSPYAASKAGADHLVHAYAVTYDLPAVVTHSCNVYGPNQYPEKLIPLFITNLLEEKKVPMYGDGSQVREWIYVDDHAQSIDFITHYGKVGEAYNIGTMEAKENKEVTMRILHALGHGEDMIEYVADRPGHDKRYAVHTGKLQTLGFTPHISFEEGMDRTVRWYQENKRWWQRIKEGSFQEYYTKQYAKRGK